VISACGNFTILGTEGGWIEKFNLQSGISRGSYIDTLMARQCAHDGEVVGLACDATNGSLISAGYHGDIKVLPSLLYCSAYVSSIFFKEHLVLCPFVSYVLVESFP